MNNLTNLTKTLLQSPYKIYLRINQQQTFEIANLCLGDFLPLKHNDEYTVTYVRKLIASGEIDNTEEIQEISRSMDNSHFVPLDMSSLETPLDQAIAEGMELLEGVEALEEAYEIDDAENPLGLNCNVSEEETSESLPYSPETVNIPSNCNLLPVIDTLPPQSMTSNQSVQGKRNPQIQSNKVSAALSNTSPSVLSSRVTNTPVSIAVSSSDTSSMVSAAKTPFFTSPSSAGPSSSVSESEASNLSSGPVLFSKPSSFTILASSSKDNLGHPEIDTYCKHNPENRHSKLKSQVWESFVKVDSVSARCKICTKVLKHGGNTTNLKQHLDRRHLPYLTSNKRKSTSDSDGILSKRCREKNEDDPTESHENSSSNIET